MSGAPEEKSSSIPPSIGKFAIFASGALFMALVNSTLTPERVSAGWGALVNPDPPETVGVSSDALTDENTPFVGQATNVVGWGDSEGGRPPIPYVGNTPTSTTPALNGWVDVSSIPGLGDERQFVWAKVTHDETYIQGNGVPLTQSAEADRGDVVRLWVYVDNNAMYQSDCTVLEGDSVARNVRLRVAIWSSEDGDEHVLRAWLAADNSAPRWVTAAAKLETPRASALEYDTELSRSYMQTPPGFEDVNIGAEVMESGGVSVGGDGHVGSCWENRVWLLLPFHVKLRDAPT